MQLGIFAKTFSRPALEEVMAAVAAHGFSTIQFNFSSAGLASLPSTIDEGKVAWISGCLDAYELSVAAVSGTFNMAHPEKKEREEGLRGLEVVARHCAALGTSIITLCTGTRAADNMWRAHPDNESEAAWHDLVVTLEGALSIAQRFDVTLAFEPEQANVINSAPKARRLLDLFPTQHLGVVLDAANLLGPGDLSRQHQIVGEAIELLAKDIVLAHAKDLAADGTLGGIAPGQGLIDFASFFAQLQKVQFHGAVIAHGFEESAAEETRRFLQMELNKLAAVQNGQIPL